MNIRKTLPRRLPAYEVVNEYSVMKRRIALLVGAFANLAPHSWAEQVRVASTKYGSARWGVRNLARFLSFGSFHRRKVFECFEPSRLRLAGNDSVITRTVFWHGVDAYEAGEVTYWERLCKQVQGVREVGGNIGIYTIVGALSNPTANYQVYEPHPAVFAALKYNLELNQISNVELHQVAVVGDAPGEGQTVKLGVANVEVDWHELPLGSGVAPDSMETTNFSMTIDVPAVAASTVFAGADLVKIDAEGIEASLIRGAWSQILIDRPILLLEVLPGAETLVTAVQDLLGLGYLIRSGGWREPGYLSPTLVNSVTTSTSWGESRDWLLVPNEKQRLLPT